MIRALELSDQDRPGCNDRIRTLFHSGLGNSSPGDEDRLVDPSFIEEVRHQRVIIA